MVFQDVFTNTNNSELPPKTEIYRKLQAALEHANRMTKFDNADTYSDEQRMLFVGLVILFYIQSHPSERNTIIRKYYQYIHRIIYEKVYLIDAAAEQIALYYPETIPTVDRFIEDFLEYSYEDNNYLKSHIKETVYYKLRANLILVLVIIASLYIIGVHLIIYFVIGYIISMVITLIICLYKRKSKRDTIIYTLFPLLYLFQILSQTYKKIIGVEN